MDKLATLNNEMMPITKETVKEYICKTATDSELNFFIELCKAQNLNPWIKEAYLVKYGQNANIIVSKDVFLKRAYNQPDFNGLKAGIMVDGAGGVQYKQGAIALSSEKIVGGWAEVYRKGIDTPFRSEVSMAEYNSNQSNWKKMPATMIRKVALVHSLRECYPSEFQGMYDESELDAMQGNVSKQAETVVLVSDKQVEEIRGLLPGSGKTEADICKAFKAESLQDLSTVDYERTVKRLKDLAKDQESKDNDDT